VWQRLYDELKDENFVIVSVALDSGGAEAARPAIEAAQPTFPVLIDAEHQVAALYRMVHVPQAVWINEQLRIVRPTEPAAAIDAFRVQDRVTYEYPAETREWLRSTRRSYFDAIRDWVAKGDASEFAYSEQEALARLREPTDAVALAYDEFQLGQQLYRAGKQDDGERLLESAKRRDPENWNSWRQTWNLQGAGTAPYWERVDALGDLRYFERIDMPGMR
jgi:hypothetical protein